MKVVLGFFLGLGIGIYAVYYYVENKAAPAVLSEVITVTVTPQVTNKPEEFFVTESSPMPTETPTVMPTVTNKITPTKKITLTPTKKPSATPTIQPTKTLTPTVTVSPTPFITTTKTPTPTLTSAAPVKTYTSAEINGFIDRFAGQYGVDPNVLRHIAVCESGFNPNAVGGGGLYVGLYQFGVSAWNTYRGRIGESSDPNLRYDAEEAVQTAAYVVSSGNGGIWPNCMP